jgi:hypothetical protein
MAREMWAAAPGALLCKDMLSLPIPRAKEQIDAARNTLMWNEETMAALQGWLGASTWHTLHSLDQDRFFRFVHAAWMQHQRLWDEPWAREELLRESRRLHPDFDESERERVIDDRRRKAAIILQFLAFAKESELEL